MKPSHALVASLGLAVVLLAAYAIRNRNIAIERSAEIEHLISATSAAPAVSDAWKLVTADAPFSARDGAFAASFKGYIWIANGWTGDIINNAIYRSKDGKDWEIAVAKAPWPNRHLGNFLVFKDRLWMFGGDYASDIWSSADGITWVREADSPMLAERYSPYMGVFDDQMWVVGGSDENNNPLNDVWSSRDGKRWEQVLNEVPWAPRGLISGFAVQDGTMWLMGGGAKVIDPSDSVVRAETIADYNDVWKSEDGKNWILVDPRADWAPRTHHSIIAFDDHLIVTDGSVGRQSNLSSEAWASTDGVSWAPIGGIANQAFPPRHASSLVIHEGALYLIAGYLHNDVWRLDSIPETR